MTEARTVEDVLATLRRFDPAAAVLIERQISDLDTEVERWMERARMAETRQQEADQSAMSLRSELQDAEKELKRRRSGGVWPQVGGVPE